MSCVSQFCYECSTKSHYLFPDGRCKTCTRLTTEEVRGELPINPEARETENEKTY